MKAGNGKNQCKLCLKEAELQKSHVIPDAFLRKIKRSGQALTLKNNHSSHFKRTNLGKDFGAYEYLLCRNCEGLLSKEYEKYSLEFLRGRYKVEDHKGYLIYHGFDFERFYLFALSILWRASIASSPQWQGVTFPEGLIKVIGTCIKSKNLKLSASQSLDNFFKICLVKVTDKESLVRLTIDEMIIPFGRSQGNDVKDGVVYYFMAEGFLFLYYFKVENDIHVAFKERYQGQLRKRSLIKIPKINYDVVEEIHYCLQSIALAVQSD